MTLTKEQINQIRKELSEANNPLFFFDDDPDGLTAFLLLYRSIKQGHGVVVKSLPELQEIFIRKVKEYDPDIIFILDKPKVSQDFIDNAKKKIIWIDHHEPQNPKGVMYFNPRKENPEDNLPSSYLCYQIVKRDLWIAAIGTIADWVYKKDIYEPFSKMYPDILPPEVNDPEKALFETNIGKLARIFSFILKGDTRKVMACVKILTRIDDPREILDQKTSQAKYLHKRYQKVNDTYQILLRDAIKNINKKDSILLYTYSDKKMSLTSDLSNELLHMFPEKLIVIGREKSGEMKCSLRSTKMMLPPVIKECLKGLRGYGGGHEYACGACVNVNDFDEFMSRLRRTTG